MGQRLECRPGDIEGGTMEQAHRPRLPSRRSNRGYLLLAVETVSDENWMSQPNAARHLGITLARVGVLIANRHLTPEENPAGQAGVTVADVHSEATWRAGAPPRAKLGRLLRDTLNWF